MNDPANDENQYCDVDGVWRATDSFVGDKMTVFSENVRSDFDDVFVTSGIPQMIKHLPSSVLYDWSSIL